MAPDHVGLSGHAGHGPTHKHRIPAGRIVFPMFAFISIQLPAGRPEVAGVFSAGSR